MEVVMFFVDKVNKNSKNSVLQLIESKRVAGISKQRIVISLGANLIIPQKIRREVARVVTMKLKGQILILLSPEVEKYADIIIRQIQENDKKDDLKEINKKADIQEVYIDQVTHSYDRIAGPLIIGNSAWKKLKMDEILKSCNFSSKQMRVAEISILNRLISQDSENAIPSWTKVYATSDLIDHKSETFNNDLFYRISDKLFKNKKAIEDQLYQNAKNLFSLDNSLILYDLTNTYFEGQAESNPKAEFSMNQKEKRTDCPQIVIALMIDGDGFVIRHKIFKGKMSDSKSLVEILETIQEDYKDIEDKPTIIFDRGITSNKNIEYLTSDDFKFKYIIASRNTTEDSNLKEFQEEKFVTIKDEKNNEVKVFQKKHEDEHYLLCKSSGRKRKEESMRNRREIKMLEEISKLSIRIFTKTKIYEPSINQNIGRLCQKYATISHYYDISFTPSKFNYAIIDTDKPPKKQVINFLERRIEKFQNRSISYQNLQKEIENFKKNNSAEFDKINIELIPPILSCQTIEEKLERKKTLEGNYLLRTNRDDLDDVTFWNTYTMLTRIEHAFRHLKTDLGLRPNQHHREDRVESHVFISILAYQHLQTIEYELRQNNCFLSWASIKRIVTSHSYSSILLPTRNGKTINIRKAGIPEAIHKSVYEKLNINYEKLPQYKRID